MMNFRCIVLLASLLLVTGISEAGPRRHYTRSGCLPAVPSYSYQYLSFSAPIRAVSLAEVTVETAQREAIGGAALDGQPVNRGGRERIRHFSLSQRELRINHCSVSELAVVLHEDGYWTLSLRAVQNPAFIGTPGNKVSRLDGAIPVNGLETNQLLRNLFFVRIRGLGAFAHEPSAADVCLGKPVLVSLDAPSFWVQRGQPRSIWVKQVRPDVAKYFDLIDRVEVEFFYR